MIGIAVRTKNYLEINLAPVVWKAIVEEPISRSDIKDIDLLEMNRLQDMRRPDFDASYFSYVEMAFTVRSLGGSDVELHAGGALEAVTMANVLRKLLEGVEPLTYQHTLSAAQAAYDAAIVAKIRADFHQEQDGADFQKKLHEYVGGVK